VAHPSTPASAHGATGSSTHVDRLLRTRQRTLAAIQGVSAVDLQRAHSPLLSPIVWDLAHIAAFADLWVATVTDTTMVRPELADIYDAGVTPRAQRAALQLLDLAGAVDYLARVDERLHHAAGTLDLSADSASPLLRNGYLIDLLVEHEEQHRETMLQALHLAEPGVCTVGPPAAWCRRSSTRAR